MLSPGQTIDRYTVDAVLGQGGMAVVYRVVHQQLGSFHALKILTLQSAGLRDRLLQEGRVQASLRHPNVVAVTDVITVDGHPGLVMEYVEGPALDTWLHDHRPDVREAERLFRMIVAGVAAAHDKGLVHRDLKPANVMLAPTSGELVPKVADFGLAKALEEEGEGMGRTRSGVTMGTPAYMAPEQIRDAKNVDHRADVFSLGCILYELVTGRTPFTGPDLLSIFNAVASGSYPPAVSLNPDLPARIQNAIQACLVVDRERRVPSCRALLDILDARSSVPPVEAPSNATLHPGVTWAGTMAEVAAPQPASHPEPAPTAVPRSEPPLDGSLAPRTESLAPPSRRKWWAAGLVAALAVAGVLAVVGVGVSGWVLRNRWEARALATLVDGSQGEIAVGSLKAGVRGVRLVDVTVTATDGTPFATIDRISITGRWKPGLRPVFVPEAAAIEGLEIEVRDRSRGLSLPDESLKLLRGAEGPLAGVGVREVTTDAATVALSVRGDRLVTTWSSARLSDVAKTDGDWAAGGFTVTDLRVGTADPLLTASALSVGADGAMTATGLELWLRLRSDGLLDLPPALADRVPDWLGGERRGASDTSWTELAHTLLPTVPTALTASAGTLHLLDRAHAVKAVDWTVALDRVAVGPTRDGWTPVELSGGIGGARASLEAEVRDDGMVRGQTTVRRLPLGDLAPYMDPSLRHYQVRPVSGTVELVVGFTAKEDSIAADVDARAEEVRFAAAEARPGAPSPPRGAEKLLATRAVVTASGSTAGSLGDWDWHGARDLTAPLVDALFAPAGKARYEDPPAAPVAAPEPATRPAPSKPEPPPPGKPTAPEPPTAPSEEPRPRDKFGKEVREALEEMKERFPSKRSGG